MVNLVMPCCRRPLLTASGSLGGLATCIGNRAEVAHRLLLSALAALERHCLFANLFMKACMEALSVCLRDRNSFRVCAQANPSAVLVSKRQEGNPLLKFMRNVRWQWADIVPDYQMGPACALFLSLRRVPRTARFSGPECVPGTGYMAAVMNRSGAEQHVHASNAATPEGQGTGCARRAGSTC